jgi:hypothetical protein
MKFINSCVNSSNQNSRWIDLNPWIDLIIFILFIKEQRYFLTWHS